MKERDVQVRLTREEYLHWKTQAAARGESMSVLVRQAVRGIIGNPPLAVTGELRTTKKK